MHAKIGGCTLAAGLLLAIVGEAIAHRMTHEMGAVIELRIVEAIFANLVDVETEKVFEIAHL
jgi:hypothetical protein